LKKVTLYWSNICVLHKYEKEYLEKIKALLNTMGIELVIKFFGIGYPQRMSEALIDPSNELPDIMVSTDLEIYENRNIFSKYSSDLFEIKDWLPMKKRDEYSSLYEDSRLLPFIAIPMMVYSSTPEALNLTNKELSTLRLAFGGINNSAAKCIFKYFWSRYGKEEAENLLGNSLVLDMPIQGMQAVKTGMSEVALTPSIYALRADMETSFGFVPKDGCIALPSFISVRKSLTKDMARLVLKTIFTTDFGNYFVQNADLISLIEGSKEPGNEALRNANLLYPPRHWFETLSPMEFYEAYCKLLPKAVNYNAPFT